MLFRSSLSNPRSTNDIVWAFLRANPTLLWFDTNRVLTAVNMNININTNNDGNHDDDTS